MRLSGLLRAAGTLAVVGTGLRVHRALRAAEEAQREHNRLLAEDLRRRNYQSAATLRTDPFEGLEAAEATDPWAIEAKADAEARQAERERRRS